VAESHALKTSGNTLFGAGSYENALQTYDRALASCPNYLDFELAVLRSNVAACNLKLQAWKDAVAAADLGVEALERVEPLPVLTKAGVAEGEHGGVVAEIDDAEEARIEALRKSGRTVDEVRKLQVKLLLRRAKARTELGGWSNLQGAEEDYRTLLAPAMGSFLSATDRRGAAEAARKLGPRLNEAKEREMGEMMDKLKGLGNSLLKPFGMSTENFQFVKDEKTGGYSMNFNQNPAKK
jgi:tetratricopeptide (TPR) repeat protein